MYNVIVYIDLIFNFAEVTLKPLRFVWAVSMKP